MGWPRRRRASRPPASRAARHDAPGGRRSAGGVELALHTEEDEMVRARCWLAVRGTGRATTSPRRASSSSRPSLLGPTASPAGRTATSPAGVEGARVAVAAQVVGQVQPGEAVAHRRTSRVPSARCCRCGAGRTRLPSTTRVPQPRWRPMRERRACRARTARRGIRRRAAARARAPSPGPRSAASWRAHRSRCARARCGHRGRRARGSRPPSPWRRACVPATAPRPAGRERYGRRVRPASGATARRSSAGGVGSSPSSGPCRRPARAAPSATPASPPGRAAAQRGRHRSVPASGRRARGRHAPGCVARR